MLAREGSDPMGPFTIEPPGGNPVIDPGELWGPICDTYEDDCASQSFGPGRVFDEGTFDIFDYDGEYYWVAFHGFDSTHGFRSAAKTANFQDWIAGDESRGVPADALHDLADAQEWREDWQAIFGNTGTGAGAMFKEGDFYYHLVEASDVNLTCSYNQNWNYGLFRSTSLTNTSWEQLPAGNPIIYSSKALEDSRGILPCNVQYASIFQDQHDGYIYLMYGRRSDDPKYDGLYWYRMEKTNNLLVNANFWTADEQSWTASGDAQIDVLRLPNNSPNGTPYLSAQCAASCVADTGYYQDVEIPPIKDGHVRFGGKWMTEELAGKLTVRLEQSNVKGKVIRTEKLAINTQTEWNTYDRVVKLSPKAVKLRLMVALESEGAVYRADDLYMYTMTEDLTAPNAVHDLRFIQDGDQLIAEWTAPGNDGGLGAVSAYEIRISDVPITEENWETVTLVSHNVTPAAGGSKERWHLEAPEPAQQLYIALKATDDAGHVSLISNTAGLKQLDAHTAESHSANLQSAFFYDSFDHSALAESWSMVNGEWAVDAGALRQTSSSIGDPKKALISTEEKTEEQFSAIKAKVKVDSWVAGDYARAGVSLYNDPDNGLGYNLLFHQDNQTVQFLDDNVAWGPSYSFEWEAEKWYWFFLRHEQDSLYGKVWKDGEPEPDEWPYKWEHGGRTGLPGLNGGSADGSKGSSTVSFDEVHVYQ